ncbi:MAG: HIT domain-containing protein [Kouleothrix sp.]
MASIFSKIVSGDIPAAKVYEDDATLAFMDISPAARGHTLVISKAEYPDIFTIPPETLTAVMHTVQVVATALREVLRCDGLNLIQNTAQQLVRPYFIFMYT